MGKLIRNGVEFSGATEAASHIRYDNSVSGLESITTQAAVDELEDKKVDKSTTINGTALSSDITLSASDVGAVPTTRTINGQDLTANRILKSAQFAEAVTGEKMLANLLYTQVGNWDSGAAQSIKLGNGFYLDASGVDGIKAMLTSGDLDDYYGLHKSGMYYLGAVQTAFTNAPTGWAGLLVCSQGNVSFQLVWNSNGVYVRNRAGNPAAWGAWHHFIDTVYEKGKSYYFNRQSFYGMVVSNIFYFIIPNCENSITNISISGTQRIYVDGINVDVTNMAYVVRYTQNNQLSCATDAISELAGHGNNAGVIEIRDGNITFS